MERKITADLLKWKKDLNRKPLLIYGNKQIGKTYSAIEFGEKEYKTVAYINSENNIALSNILEKERTILREQAENEGLDPSKLDMIVNGRVNKYYEEVCLVDQGYIKENKMKVNKFVESKNSSVLSFVRYEVGEGMEKREENFADEVAKQING